MKAPLAILVAVSLTGCIPPPPVVTAPTAAEIAAAQHDVAAAHLPPQDYVNFGLTLADHSCDAKFSALVEEAQNTTAAAQTLSMAGAAATVAGGPAGSAAGALLPLLSAALGNYQSTRPGGISPALVRGLVKRTQTAWLTSMPVALSDADAFALVESYAELCQPPAVLQAIHDAMSTAVITAAPVDTPPEAASADFSPAPLQQRPRRRVLLPVVRINPLPPPAVPAAAPDAQIRKMRIEWIEIQRRGGRNAAEGGPRALPPVNHPIIDAPPPALLPPRGEGETVSDPAPQDPTSAAAQLPPSPSTPKRKL